MAWMLPAAMVASSLIGTFGKKDKDGMQTTSTMTVPQLQIMRQLKPFISSRIGRGLEKWPGDFTAPLSMYEQMGLDRLGGYLSTPSTLQEIGVGAYGDLLKGWDPQQTFNFYEQYIAPQEERWMKERIIPQAREEFVPTGNIYGTPRYDTLSRMWGDFGAGQLSRIGQMIQAERERAAGLIPYISEMIGVEGGVPQIEAAMAYGAIPRLLEQQELTAQFEEFKRTSPELSPILDLAMRYIGEPAKAAYYQEAPVSPIASLMESLPFIMMAMEKTEKKKV